jgi:hypothetical protein
MRYFDQELVANSRPHAEWWRGVCVLRNLFHHHEVANAAAMADLHTSAGIPRINAASVLPRDAWLELDAITRRVLRNDEGEAYMQDLMPLAKPVNIGKIVHMNRVATQATKAVQRSISGQTPAPLDKTGYDYRGVPVPIFMNAYGREWREWSTLQSENFDALADDQFEFVSHIREDQADFVLNGDTSIVFQGYTAYGIKNSPYTKLLNLGSAVGGANIDLSSASTTADQIEGYINGPFGAALDANYIGDKRVNLYISPEIARNWDRPYSLAAGFKVGSIRDFILGNRRIAKITTTWKLTGNEFFAFVPDAQYIRPLIGMAVNTVAAVRLNPNDNYQFMNWGALGIEIRADANGRSGVFASTDID